MTKLFRLFNTNIGVDHTERQWLTVGQSMAISPNLEISLQCHGDLPLLKEHNTFTDASNLTPIQDGNWLKSFTRAGYLEIIPKAIRLDQFGRADAVLLDFLETPAVKTFAV